MAVLYKNNEVIQVSRYYLGMPEEHTVYKAELIRIILTIHLLFKFTYQITRKTIIRLDNQAAIQALTNQSAKPSHYLLNQIHSAAEKLHDKQDKLQNASDFHKAKQNGLTLTAKMKGVLNLRVSWVPGHKDFTLNEKADEHTKRAARGNPTSGNLLPKLLKKQGVQSFHRWLTGHPT